MDGKENEITNGAGATNATAQEGSSCAQAAGAAGAPPVTGSGTTGSTKAVIDYAVELASRDAQIAERDAKITELESQAAEAEKLGGENAALKSEVEQLKNQAASDRIDFALQLAGCRNVKAARAVLDDYDGDIEKMKAAEPYLFAAHAEQSGATGLPNAGTASENGKDEKRWRKLVGLSPKKTD